MPRVAMANKTIALDDPIIKVSRIGTKSAARLAQLGIRTVRELLWHLPSRYDDYREIGPIARIIPGQTQSVQGVVVSVANRSIWPKRMSITTATIKDDTGAIRAVWFNRPYLADTLEEGSRISVSGKVVLDQRGLYFSNPSHERVGNDNVAPLRHTGRLVPVYPETYGVTSKFLRFLIHPLLESVSIDDPLPSAIRRKFKLLELREAIQNVHYPSTQNEAEEAKRRLAFDELITLNLKTGIDRRARTAQKSPAIAMDVSYMRAIVPNLPFTLTKDQRRAAAEVLRDMERPQPMNRLLEGDVGSGKTAVAALAAFHAAHSGWQSVFMVPTEILARQHEISVRKLATIAPETTIALLVGSGASLNGVPCTKKTAYDAISRGVVQIVIGTHAVIQEKVKFRNLALAIVDEQHRFGVSQRAALIRRNIDQAPHLLSMTATPIPRTLALTVFGDLDISLLREKPAGRPEVTTKVVLAHEREQAYEIIRKEARMGRQTFVICPMIERAPKDENAKPKVGRALQTQLMWAEVRAAQEEHERLTKTVFPDLKVSLVHGRLKPAEKDRVMNAFRAGLSDVLVATSVVEVGVDIPNATVMLIEGAERFGLAQLHQFRGRIGRGEHPAHCFLSPTDSGIVGRRLRVMEKTNDGFKLAEQDLKIRGPGEISGLKQSGFPDATMRALTDQELVRDTRMAADLILSADPKLEKVPLLKEAVTRLTAILHRE